MNITAVSHTFPTEHNPAQGKIIQDELDLQASVNNISLIVPTVKSPGFLEQSRRADRHLPAVYPISKAPYFSIPKRHFPAFIQQQISRAVLQKVPAQTDIVHVHWLYPNGLCVKALKKRGFKVVLTIHGTDWTNVFAKKRLKPYVEEALHYADAINTVGSILKKDIVRFFPQYESKINVVHHAIDTELFQPSRHKREANPNQVQLLSVANLFEVKGLDILIDALSILPEKLKQSIKLTIIAANSEQKFEAFLSSKIDSAGLTNRVQILKSLAHHKLVEHYQKADLFILPSRFEAFGLALAEAASCGLPSISTTSGGPEEIVSDPAMGTLVETENARALSDAIAEMLRNLDNYSGQTIRSHIIEHFSRQSKLDKLMSIYERVLFK